MREYPHLRLIPGDEVPLRYRDRVRELVRVSSSVRSRTGVSAWLDCHTADLCFGHVIGGTPRCIIEIPLYRDPCRTVERRITDTDIDDVCTVINRADKVSMFRKEWRAGCRRRDEENAQASERERLGDEYAETIAGLVPRTGALVNGMKEQPCRSAAES